MNKYLLTVLVLVTIFNTKISAQLTATTTSGNPNCANNNGSATVMPAGGNIYTYKWSNGATTASVSNLAAGTYTVTVYSSGGTLWDTLYLETFEGTHNWTLNVSTGTNDPDHNFWQVTDDEGGVAPGGCGVAANGNKTLHVTSVVFPGGGAAYDAGSQGLCSQFPGLNCTNTAQAATSPNINTAGATNLVLRYDFIGGGQTNVDLGSSLYSINGGSNFTSLDALLRSVNTGCGGQGKWTQRSYNLPANTIGVNNFQVRFNWKNDDDAAGTDPSIAINNVLLRDSVPLPGDSIVKTVTLTLPTPPHFVTAALSVVNPSCGQSNGSINNVGVAGGTTPYTLVWTVSGAQIGSSNSITNVGPGTYTFTATDANSCSIDTSFTLVANSGGNPVTISTAQDTICSGDSTQICAPGGAVSYLWNTAETTQCIQAKLAGNYYVTVTESGNCTALSNAIYVAVNTPPSVSISVSGDTLSSIGASSYQWIKNGTDIPNATNSIYVVTASGNYSVRVTDANGCSSVSNAVPIIVSSLENLSAEGIETYPNPVTNSVEVRVANFVLNDRLRFQIFDVAGRQMLNGEVTKTRSQIDMSSFSSGIYLLKISGKVIRLVKN